MRLFKFSFSLTALLIFLSSLAFAAPQIPPAALTQVCSAIVYDLDNEAILFEQNADEKIQPASLTKVLSMFLAMDFIKSGQASLQDNVSISSAAAGTGGSRMGLRAHETVPFGKLLLGMAVSSGNDASHAVAEHVGGTVDAFVKMMNARCAQLGMEDSNFVNPHGLPSNAQHTTARDMLTLARAYLRAHPDSLDFHNTLIMEHGGYRTWNKNPLLGQYPGADGLKTGWVRASGYNLIFTATRNNHRLLAVIMGAPDIFTRGAEACRLLDAGFMVCGDQAVSVAAALDNLIPDPKRIDPRKTARDHGIACTRAVAKASFSKTKYGRRSISVQAEKRLLAKKNAKLAHNLSKSAKIQNKSRSATKIKTHAERKISRSKRG